MHLTRRLLQGGFLALTLAGVFVFAGNAERWCPFGGVEALYTYVAEGNLPCSLAVTNFYILGAVLLMTLLVRRGFCAYVCPIGTISEWIHRAGARLGMTRLTVPPRLDGYFSLLKYAVLAVILYFTYRSSELIFRGYDPCYALIGRHGEDITFWAYVVAGAIVVGSLLMVLPFCRWLCPLAAVLNPVSRLGLGRVKRDPVACVQCRRCAAECPMGIPVDQVEEVRASRCLSCMQCVEACPVRDGGALCWGPPERIARRWPAGIVAAVILLCTTGAVTAAWLAPLPSFVAARGEPPMVTARTDLAVSGLSCRGRATLLMYYLERDDSFALPGYIKLDAWPGPGEARVQVTYEPAECDEVMVKEAITEPYYDAVAGIWRPSPFVIAGFDPLAGP